MKVRLYKDEMLELYKLYALKQVSEKLTGMKGTLHLENYDGTTASIIFKKEN